MNPILILLLAALTVIIFILYSFGIQLATKMFRLQRITFLQAFRVFLLFSIVTTVIGCFGYFLKLPGLASILGYVLGSIVAYTLYKKYVPVSAGKFTLVWISALVINTIIAILLIVVIRLYIAQPFAVSGNSMAPAYPDGTYLILEEWDKSVQKNDVVIEKSSDGIYVIARVTALPGDTVNGAQVPMGEYYLSKDSPTATYVPGLTSANAIVGKPLLDLGVTSYP